MQGAGFKSTLPGSSVKEGVCEHGCKRTTIQAFKFEHFDGPPVWTHKSCVCNEVIALKGRHQLDDGARYTGPCLKNTLRKFCDQHLLGRIAPVSEETVIAHAVPSKRKLLLAAQESLRDEALRKKDNLVKMFLKDDKYTGEFKAPRCIQYRNKRYCLRLARWMIPIERSTYTWVDSSGAPVFAKGRNMRQRGRDIFAKFSCFVKPAVVSMDHSKFDSHVNPKLLQLEHWYYNTRARDPELARLLAGQTINKGRTKNNTRYTTVATRMSGDQNTGLGNCIINFAMTRHILDKLQVKYCLYIDGDDFLVFIEAQDVALIDPTLYEQFGMRTTIDSVAYRMEHIEFCQTRPVYDIDESYTMVRNPRRLLTRVPWVIGPRGSDDIKNILYSTGLCEMALGRAIPVAQYVGQTLSTHFKGKYKRTDLHYRACLERIKPQRAKIVQPTEATRVSYEAAWGVPIPQQLEWESMKIGSPEGEVGLEFPLSRFH